MSNTRINTVSIGREERGLRCSSVGCATRFVVRIASCVVRIKHAICITHDAVRYEPRNRNRFTNRLGMTLAEMAVVIGIIALMVGLTLPVANMLYNSFESTGGVEAMINAALESAKSIAIKEQRYAGIRFQKRYDPANPDPLNQSQYIIYIIKKAGQQSNSLDYGFCAVDGIQPIKLPDSIGVMDLKYNSKFIGDGTADSDTELTNPNIFRDITTFSIIFSPSGKLIIHDVRVRNRDEIPDSPGEIGNPSYDDIFNKKADVDNGIGMFYQDDYAAQDYRLNYYPTNWGLGQESSRNSFIIYDTRKFKQEYKKGTPYSGYLNQLKPVFVSPYTGTIIEEK
jgi:type II secretory pathway pseudopilin PulG